VAQVTKKKAPKRSAEDQTAFSRAVENFQKSEMFHTEFSRRVDRAYDAYRGLLSVSSEAADWTSKQHPPYIHQVIETITSSLVDPTFRFQVKPRPKAIPADQWQSHIKAAETLERLLAFELDTDDFDIKQRPFILQGNIAGLTVGKTFWNTKKGTEKKLQMGLEAQFHPDTGMHIGYLPQMQEVSTECYLRDGPCMEPVDVRDFFWQEGAISLEHSGYVIHRLWKTMDEIRYLESINVYGASAGGESCSALAETQDQSGELTNREQKYSRELRTKERVEVLEYWTDKEVVTIGNKTVLMSRKPNPFNHGQKPFFSASPMPDLFRIPGMSVVDLVRDIQEMLWTLGNQRLDATRLLANPAYAVRNDLDDPAQLEEIAPGQLYFMEDVNQVKPFEINPQIPRMTLDAEAKLQGDIQNVSSGGPFMSGTDAGGGIDQKTATGVSIVSNLAQKQMQARKSNYTQAFEKMGWQWACMIQQFIREEKAIPIVGPDADMTLLKVNPQDIQVGLAFDVEIDGSNDSMIRQEARAEKQAMVQTLAQIAPVASALGTPLNMKFPIQEYLKTFGYDDTDAFFTEPSPAGPPGAPGAPPGQPQPGGAPTGITNPQAAAGPQAVSNGQSMSPAAAMQQFGAMKGGPVNH
jgi:hypothetical protein